MGGIAVSYGTSDESGLRRMLDKLKHRGNTTEIRAMDNVALGLRINNMHTGKQLGENNAVAGSGKFSAVCDGYFFFDTKLRHDYGKIVAKAYVEKGRDFLNNLEGSFALAVTDGDFLLAARDPFGIKPLYYGRNKGIIYFASEMKELLEVTTDINIFPPGHCYIPGEGFQKFTQDTVKTELFTNDPEKAANTLRQSMIQAVEKRYLQNEHPGILLSGGLDSSVVAAAVAQCSESMRTFAVGLEGSPDLEAASLVARHLGAKHYEHVYTKEEIMDVLSEVIYYLESFDAPLVQSAVANYFASKLAAAAGCRSVLCGEGADELFGGYHYVKTLESEEAMQKEFENIFFMGHAMGFQRVDRMNSAHCLESYIPFMDGEILELAAVTPLDWKIHGPEQVEKWILRRAFLDDLPEEIVWRRKAQFSHGTNCDTIMDELSANRIKEAEFEKAKKENSHILLRTKEEYLYYSIFKEHFPQYGAIKSVLQWSELEGDIC